MSNTLVEGHWIKQFDRSLLFSSSLKVRLECLRIIEQKLSSQEIGQEYFPQVLQLIFSTYQYYCDRSSRQPVQRCIRYIFETATAPESLESFICMINSETLKQGIAPVNAYILTEWCGIILELTAGTEFWPLWGLATLEAHARALEICIAKSRRPHIKHAALVASWRALRKTFAKDPHGVILENAIDKLCAKPLQPSFKNAIMLGAIAGVCARRLDAKRILESKRSQYYNFYTRELIGSRIHIPPYIAKSLDEFFTNFAEKDGLEREIVPTLEKALLRVPEIVLVDLFIPLVNSIPLSIDFSIILHKNLLKPLISITKSTNPAIRLAALLGFKAAALKCHDFRIKSQIFEEILAPIESGKLPSAEQRSIHAEMIASIPEINEIAAQVGKRLADIAKKETNEAALASQTHALSQYLIRGGHKNEQIDENMIAIFIRGISDKKAAVKKIWITCLGELFWGIDNKLILSSKLDNLAVSILPHLLLTWKDVVTNPMVATQSGLIMVAYVIFTSSLLKLSQIHNPVVIAELEQAQIIDNTLIMEPRPSYLFNPRVYGKLTNVNDLKWFLRALICIMQQVTSIETKSLIALAWSQALIFCICSTGIKFDMRRDAARELFKAYICNPSYIGQIIIAGLWRWHTSVVMGEKESAAIIAKTGNENLHHVIGSICPLASKQYNISEEVRREQMVSLFVLSRPELIPRTSWIGLCIRTGIDPGDLARSSPEAMISEILKYTRFKEELSTQASDLIKKAAFSAAADLAFVAPKEMIPRIMNIVEQDLDPTQLSDISPLEIAIFRTQEGTVCIDTLASKTQMNYPHKNVKDYNTLKWEDDLRAQLAQKKGQEKKLSPEENTKVINQLKKEAEIRQKIRHIEARILRATGVISNLVTGPPTDASLWMGPAIKSLLSIINAGAHHITGNATSDTYISCGQKISSRIGTMKSSIGIATLRALNIPLPDNLTQEPLSTLVTRVLYRLRFAGEQRPFDNVSLVYILPLVLIVVQKGGLGIKDDADSQFVLALEFLSLHTDVCAEILVSREKILSTLITSMQIYSNHYKIIKDFLADFCRCIAPTITKSEINILLGGIVVPHKPVRTSVLQAISADIDLSELEFSDEVWLACFDDEETITLLGREIWEESDFVITDTTPLRLLSYLDSTDACFRRAAAKALAEAVRTRPHTFVEVLEKLKSHYQDLAKPSNQQLDEYGIPKKVDLSDPWEARYGIALAIQHMAPLFEARLLDSFLRFLIEMGPLADKHPKVRKEMIEAVIMIITSHGKNRVEDFMKTFEQTLERPDKGSEFDDRINEAVVIMYGALARHLKPGDVRVPEVVGRLLETLNTPSEAVQYAVAECLPPLVRASNSNIPNYLQFILDQLFNAKNYAGRRGAAYGLAGIVHGKGIHALREHRIIASLKAGMENKKNSNHREGSLLAYELLSTILGRIFEPYVIQIVPQLLTGFGDANIDVRESCLAAAKASFARLSTFGVKRILPTLLDGLDDPHWRSKKGACDLLGAMAFLNPQQLAQSLPEIIPPLSCVLNDSHKEVRLAANRSLKRFGEAISNPEIKSLVEILLKALSDPTKYTETALDSLIKVSFVHYLDAPSLALIVGILQRGLGDRSITKRKASQVIGSLAHLTERKDLTAHLPNLISGLKIAVVDPVPTTRATASKALGSLIEKLGEDALPDLIPGLLQTLKSDTGAGDRLGSAQALSEVLAGLGTSRLDETLPSIIQNASSPNPAIREGFISLFIFLPVCFGNSFAGYLSKIIPILLQGLSDDVESIRDTSLRAGRLLVKNFSTRSVELLLPELERGLADDNYRIRLSSTELIGDLLFNLTGVKLEARQDEESWPSNSAASTSLLNILGEEKRNKILSALYICRCDTSGLVRTAAMGVWKALVPGPRTLKELIPTLTKLIVNRLGSSLEQKVIAGNALSELVRKAGEGLFSSLLPVLQEGLNSEDSNIKQGICIALRELIGNASLEALGDHEKTLIQVVRTALIDSDEEVRETAAEAFDSLQQLLGKSAVDQVLPYLLNLLATNSDAKNALSALLTLVKEKVRSLAILPNLIPTLTISPMTSFNANALASLCTVAGSAMTRRLPIVLNALMKDIILCGDEDLRTHLDVSFDTVLLSVDEFDGLDTVMGFLLASLKHEDHRRRATIGQHFANFFINTTVDYARYNQDIIRTLLMLFDDGDIQVVKAAWTALNEFTKHLKKEEMETLVFSSRQALQQVGVPGLDLPGFGLPKALNAILPIFLHSLMNGNSEQRTQSVLAISDIVDKTSEESLKPFVSQITGPLIRVVSERSVDVKSAALLALNKLLGKIPTLIKPFLPQLQRTFVKCLADTSNETLRNRAATALGTLIILVPRVDPLIAELCTGAKTSDFGVKTAMLKALGELITKAGSKMNETSRAAVLKILDTDPEVADVSMAITNAKLLGALLKNVPIEVATDLVRTRALCPNPSPFSVLALNSILLELPSLLSEGSFISELPSVICRGVISKNSFISDNFILAAGKYLLSEIRSSDFEALKMIFESLADLIQPGNPADTRRLALVVVRTVCRHHSRIIRPHLSVLAYPIFASARDPIIPIKLAAEAAFVALFNIVDEESKVFDKFIASQELPPNQKKTMQDYFKRVALRLGNTLRERKEAEGGAADLGLLNDEIDDEREIWGIGKVELNETSFD